LGTGGRKRRGEVKTSSLEGSLTRGRMKDLKKNSDVLRGEEGGWVKKENP